jgi:transcriptional regulator GlxA family with amidase domain
MGSLTTMLSYLLMAGGAASAVLVVLVIYGNALDTREAEEIYLNKTEEKMMASEQSALIRKMNRLARVITVVAVTAGVFLLASAGVWVWIGLHKS